MSKYWALPAIAFGMLFYEMAQNLQPVVIDASPLTTLAGLIITTELFAFSMIKLFDRWTLHIPPPAPKAPMIKRVKPPPVPGARGRSIINSLVNGVFKLGFLNWLAGRLAISLSRDITAAGISQVPTYYVKKYMAISIVSLPVCIAAAIFLVLFVHPLGALVIFVPALIGFIPFMSVRTSVANRSTVAEKELGLFMIYASMMQSAGENLYISFQHIMTTDLFTGMKVEAAMLMRKVKLFAKGSILDGFEMMAKEHPSKKVRDLFMGYTSEYRSGGRLDDYLQYTANGMLRDEEFKWKQFASRVSTIAEVVVMTLMLFPILAAVSGIVAASNLGSTLMLVGIVASPALAVALFVTSKQAQPAGFNDTIFGNPRQALLAGAGGILVGIFAHMDPVLLFILILGSFALGYGIEARVIIGEIKQLEEGSEAFVGDLLEMRKLGFDLNGAARRLVNDAERRYSGAFLKFMHMVRTQMSMNRRLSQVEIRTPSWLVKYIFFMVSELSETGGGTPTQIESLRRFVGEIRRIKNEATASVKTYMMLAYGTPFIVFFISGLIAFMTSAAGGLPSIPGFSIQPLNPLLTEGLAASATISVVFALMKSVDLTIHNTIRLALASIITMLAVYLVPIVIKTFFHAG